MRPYLATFGKVAVLTGVILVAILIILANDLSKRDGVYPSPSVTVQPSPSAGAPSLSNDPLSLASIRTRQYAASPITLIHSLGSKGGYSQSVVSFVSDGLTEYALESTPTSTEPAGGYPVIILMHGYIPPSQYQTTGSDYSDFIAAWARAGFVVIKPDFRGNGNSQGTAVSGHYSPDYTYDVMNLIASLKQYRLVNGGRIGIFGHSMGGHVALNVAVASPDVKATVLANGVVGSFYDLFYNWPNSPASHDQPTSVVTAELNQLLAEHGTPKTDPNYYYQISAINYVSDIRGPVQIDHDTGDTTVPYAFSQSLHSVLLANGKKVTFYSYPGNDHQFASPNNHALLIDRTTSFFQQNL
jgi:dipeptidyl aminopeptidase/acylaminoacyl peptidase